MNRALTIVVGLLAAANSYAQFVDCTKGLLIMPSAEMEENGTFMISNSFLNEHFLPDNYSFEFPWDYNTFGYGFSITFWSRLEVSYVCTLFNGKWSPSSVSGRSKIVRNQDRHFAARFQLLRENDFFEWVPSVVVGISDPVTAVGGGYIEGQGIQETGNGYFNRYYIVATKHFDSSVGEFAGHAAFQYTKRKDFSATGPCVAITWNPVWLNQTDFFLSSFRLIAEYDAMNFNVGFSSSIWHDHFEGWFCFQGCQWISAGLRYKVVIR